MSRFFIKLAYNGTPFNGWQIQPNAPTVQEKIETVLSTVLREKVAVVGCGRTDSGVHASEFFAHFESNKEVDTESLTFKMNCMLPNEIAIFKIFKVPDELHARFSATARTYHYHINQVKDAFGFKQSWFMNTVLNLQKMNEACRHLFGTQDFTSFSKLHTQTHTNMCTISKAEWVQDGSNLVFTITADRFLHNMVRAIVGTCIEVGRGKITSEDFKNIIKSKSRQKAGASVPGHGLYLAKIEYPK